MMGSDDPVAEVEAALQASFNAHSPRPSVPKASDEYSQSASWSEADRSGAKGASGVSLGLDPMAQVGGGDGMRFRSAEPEDESEDDADQGH